MLQAFIPFIGKDRYLIIQLFEFLSSQQKTVYSIVEIQDILHVSAYKAKCLVHEAIILSNELPQGQLILENNCLHVTNVNPTILNTLINLEAHHSLRFKIFLHIHLNIYQQSDQEFQQSIGISASTYFRLKKELRQDIGMDKINKMYKSEVFTRYYIYQILFYFSYFDYYPQRLQNKYDLRKIKNSITYVTTIWHLRLTNSQKKQIDYFTFVNFLRSNSHKELHEQDVNYLVKINSQESINLLIKHLMKDWHLLEKKSVIVTRYFITFLISTTNLPVEKLNFTKNYDVVKEITRQQVNLTQQTINIPLVDNKLIGYQNKLLKINAKILSPFFKSDLFLIEQSWYTNPLPLRSSSNKLVDQLKGLIIASQIERFNEVELKQIENAYLLLTLSNTLTNNFSAPVHIVVDFSKGSILNDFVINGLHVLAYLNITIDSNISSYSDIYITDTYNPSFKKQQIIWEDVPQIEDWKIVHDLIIKLHNSKQPSENL